MHIHDWNIRFIMASFLSKKHRAYKLITEIVKLLGAHFTKLDKYRQIRDLQFFRKRIVIIFEWSVNSSRTRAIKIINKICTSEQLYEWSICSMSTRRVKLTCDIDSTSCNIAMVQSSRHMCRSQPPAQLNEDNETPKELRFYVKSAVKKAA